MKIDDLDLPEIVWEVAFIVTVLLWLERRLEPTLRRVGAVILRYGIAAMFLWSGTTQVFFPPGMFGQHIELFLSHGFSHEVSLTIGLWEILIGGCFLEQRWVRYGALQVLLYAPATGIPLLAVAGLESGQYVVLLSVIVGAAFVVWGAETEPL